MYNPNLNEHKECNYSITLSFCADQSVSASLTHSIDLVKYGMLICVVVFLPPPVMRNHKMLLFLLILRFDFRNFFDISNNFVELNKKISIII